MGPVTELKVSIRRMELFEVRKTSISGITRAELHLTQKSEEVVTDRIVVREGSVRLLDYGR